VAKNGNRFLVVDVLWSHYGINKRISYNCGEWQEQRMVIRMPKDCTSVHEVGKIRTAVQHYMALWVCLIHNGGRIGVNTKAIRIHRLDVVLYSESEHEVEFGKPVKVSVRWLYNYPDQESGTSTVTMVAPSSDSQEFRVAFIAHMREILSRRYTAPIFKGGFRPSLVQVHSYEVRG
jgi:hypothetical protein